MDKDVKRHPIRGAFWGLLFGLGLYLLLIGRKVVAFGSWGPLIIIMVAGVLVNVLWSVFGPAKKAKPPKGWTSSMPVEPVPAMAGAPQWTPAPTVPEEAPPLPGAAPTPLPDVPTPLPDMPPPLPDQPPPLPEQPPPMPGGSTPPPPF